MTNPNKSELGSGELDSVVGGMPFYGMGCSVNQNETIGAIDNAVGSVPIVGPILSGVVRGIGRIICS